MEQNHTQSFFSELEKLLSRSNAVEMTYFIQKAAKNQTDLEQALIKPFKYNRETTCYLNRLATELKDSFIYAMNTVSSETLDAALQLSLTSKGSHEDIIANLLDILSEHHSVNTFNTFVNKISQTALDKALLHTDHRRTNYFIKAAKYLMPPAFATLVAKASAATLCNIVQIVPQLGQLLLLNIARHQQNPQVAGDFLEKVHRQDPTVLTSALKIIPFSKKDIPHYPLAFFARYQNSEVFLKILKSADNEILQNISYMAAVLEIALQYQPAEVLAALLKQLHRDTLAQIIFGESKELGLSDDLLEHLISMRYETITPENIKVLKQRYRDCFPQVDNQVYTLQQAAIKLAPVFRAVHLSDRYSIEDSKTLRQRLVDITAPLFLEYKELFHEESTPINDKLHLINTAIANFNIYFQKVTSPHSHTRFEQEICDQPSEVLCAIIDKITNLDSLMLMGQAPLTTALKLLQPDTLEYLLNKLKPETISSAIEREIESTHLTFHLIDIVKLRDESLVCSIFNKYPLTNEQKTKLFFGKFLGSQKNSESNSSKLIEQDYLQLFKLLLPEIDFYSNSEIKDDTPDSTPLSPMETSSPVKRYLYKAGIVFGNAIRSSNRNYFRLLIEKSSTSSIARIFAIKPDLQPNLSKLIPDCYDILEKTLADKNCPMVAIDKAQTIIKIASTYFPHPLQLLSSIPSNINEEEKKALIEELLYQSPIEKFLSYQLTDPRIYNIFSKLNKSFMTTSAATQVSDIDLLIKTKFAACFFLQTLKDTYVYIVNKNKQTGIFGGKSHTAENKSQKFKQMLCVLYQAEENQMPAKLDEFTRFNQTEIANSNGTKSKNFQGMISHLNHLASYKPSIKLALDTFITYLKKQPPNLPYAIQLVSALNGNGVAVTAPNINITSSSNSSPQPPK